MQGAVAYLISSLVVLAGPSGRAPAGRERPQAFAVIPRPKEALPKLRDAAERLLGKPAGAGRFGADAARVGFDLLDPAALERAGVATDAPIWIVAPRGQRAPLLEFTLRKPELADAAIAHGLTSAKDARALSASSSKPQGLAIGSPEDPSLVVWRSGAQLYVRPWRSGVPTTEQASLDLAKTMVKPAIPKLAGPRDADVLLIGRGVEGIDRVEAGLWIDADAIQVRSDLHLDFTTGLLLGDLAVSSAASAPLVAGADPAIELTAFLPPSSVTAALDAESMSIEHARVLDGRFHVVLSRGGSLAAVASLTEGARDEAVTMFAKALAKKYPEAQIERSAPRRLTALFPGADVEDARGSLMKAPKEASSRAPVELRVQPKVVFDALSARARSRKGPAAPAARVAVGRYLAADLVRSASDLRVELSFGPGVVHATARLALERR